MRLGRRANRGIRVLVVDDSDSVRGILRSHLVSLVISDVVEAANGQDALALAISFRPDLVLLDTDMPVMNGFEFLQTFRERNQRTPVFMLTTERDCRREIDAIGNEIAGHLTKPVTRDRLAERLREFLSTARRAA